MTTEQGDVAKALFDVLSRRQAGEFVTAEDMDARLERMIARKKRAPGVLSP